MTTMDEVRDLWNRANAYTLADWSGEIPAPGPGEAGAAFLLDVRDAVVEAAEGWTVDDLPTGGDWSDVAYEIADGAVPVYTVDVWRTFVDLRAWDVDVDYMGDDADSDMTWRAKRALYEIARSVAWAMLGMLDEVDGDA